MIQTFSNYLNEMKKQWDYSSTQVNLPDDLSASVVGWGTENIPDQDIYTDYEEPNYGREPEPHVTILYGLYEKNAQKIRYIIENEKPLDIRLGAVTIFHNDNFDVIKIDVKCKALHELYSILSDKFPHKKTHPIYIPHITIAYVKKGKGKDLNNNDFFQGKKFTAKQILFSNKNGIKSFLSLRGRGNHA